MVWVSSHIYLSGFVNQFSQAREARLYTSAKKMENKKVSWRQIERKWNKKLPLFLKKGSKKN
jgi:hypothetical protein